MAHIKNVYSISRKSAAESLKVSPRTLDRYIGDGTISYRKINRRIWLNKLEIEELARKNLTFFPVFDENAKSGLSRQSSRQSSRQNFNEKNEFSTVEGYQNIKNIFDYPKQRNHAQISQEVQQEKQKPEHEEHEIMKSKNSDENSEEKSSNYSEKIFQKLYTELISDMKEQQKRLEGANYRVGQLEAQIKNTVPLLDHHAESLRLKEREKELIQEKEAMQREVNRKKEENNQLVRSKVHEVQSLAQKLYTEKINKWAYIIVLFMVLFAQPLLWLLLRK